MYSNSILGLLRRAYIHLDINSLAILYKALVRPHLEFANVIWHPYKKKHIHAIEAVQRRATKLLSILKNLTYKERLIKLNIPTLVFRRLRGDMIETFKITSEIYDPNVTSFINTHANSRTRGNQHKLYLSRANSELRRNYFSLRVVTAWNALPDNVITAPNVNCFKSRLDKLWENSALKLTTWMFDLLYLILFSCYFK